MSPIDGLSSPQGHWYPVSQVAKQTPYSATFVRQLARQGKIDAVKIGRDWLTTEQSVLQYIQVQQERHKKALAILQTAEKAFLTVALIAIVFSATPKAQAEDLSTRSVRPENTVSATLHNLISGWQDFVYFDAEELAAVFRVNGSSLAEQADQFQTGLLWQRQETCAVLVSLGQALLGKTPEEYLADAPVPVLEVARYSPHSRGLSFRNAVPTSFDLESQQPEVLGLSTTRTPNPPASKGDTAKSGITQTQIQNLIDQTFQRYIVSGAFTGPQGPQGLPGPTGLVAFGFSGANGMVQNGNGQTTSVIGGTPIVSYYPAVPSQNFTGTSLAGFGSLSAGTLASGNTTISGNLNVSGPISATGAVTVGSLNSSGNDVIDGTLSAASSTLASLVVSGPATFTGSTTIAGLTVTGFNPGLTPGSIAFQGSSALVQDNGNFFYDSTDHRLGLGTTTPSQLLTVAGNGMFTGQLSVAGPTALGTTTIANLTLAAALSVSSGGTGISTSPANNGQLLLASSTGWTVGSLAAGSNVIISTSTPGQIIIAAAGSGLIGSGTAGYDTLWNNGNTLGAGVILNSSSVAGINATSSSYTFNLQGSLGINPFNVSSSSGTSLLTVLGNGNVGIGTTSPSSSLVVQGDTNISGSLMVQNTAFSGQTGNLFYGRTDSKPGAAYQSLLTSASTFSITSTSTWLLPSYFLSQVVAGGSFNTSGAQTPYASINSEAIMSTQGQNQNLWFYNRGLGIGNAEGLTGIVNCWGGAGKARISGSNPYCSALGEVDIAQGTDITGATLQNIFAGTINGSPTSTTIPYSLVEHYYLLGSRDLYDLNTLISNNTLAGVTVTGISGTTITFTGTTGFTSAIVGSYIKVGSSNDFYQPPCVGDDKEIENGGSAYPNGLCIGVWYYISGFIDANHLTIEQNYDTTNLTTPTNNLSGTCSAGACPWAIIQGIVPTSWTSSVLTVPANTFTGNWNSGDTLYSPPNPHMSMVGIDLQFHKLFPNISAPDSFYGAFINNNGPQPMQYGYLVGGLFNAAFDSTASGTTGVDLHAETVSGQDLWFPSKGIIRFGTLGNTITGVSASGGTSFSQSVEVGTSTALQTFVVQGTTTKDILNIVSSSGASLLYVKVNGNVGIGTTTPNQTLTVQGSGTTNLLNIASSSGASDLYVANNGSVGIGTTSPQYLLQVGSASVASGTVARFQNINGTCDINPTTNTLACSSDEHLKKNITPMTDNLSQVMALQPVYFNWNAENAGTAEHPGFVAQQVQQIMPEVVSTDPTTGLLSIGYSDLVPVMVGAMQQMQAEITTLQGGLTGNATTSNLTVYSPFNFSGDSVGEAEILAGSTSAKVNFSQPYEYQPIVVATPMDFVNGAYRVTLVDSTGFTVEVQQAQPRNIMFNWHAFASPAAQLTVSNGTTRAITLVVAIRPPADPSDPGQGSVAPAAGNPGVSSSLSSGQVLGDATTSPDSSTSTRPGFSGSSTPDSKASASSSPPLTDQLSGAQVRVAGTLTSPSDSGTSPTTSAALMPPTQPSTDPSTSSMAADNNSSETASPPSDASSAAGGSATPPPESTSATPTVDSSAGSTSQ